MTMLRDNPARYPGGKPEFKNTPINFPNNPMEGIAALEKEYNNGRAFPLAYREYLFLAGDFCHVRVTYIGSARKENEKMREDLKRTGKTIPRPFFVFETAHGSHIFYLDEDTDDPRMHWLEIDIEHDDPNGNHTYSLEIEPKDFTLTELINHRIKSHLEFQKKYYPKNWFVRLWRKIREYI